MRALLMLFLLAGVLPIHALTLDELRKSLVEYRGAAPLRVKIDSSERRNDGDRKLKSSGSQLAEDDGVNIRMVHDKAALRRQEQEKRRADHTVSARTALELMNFGPALIKSLEGATLERAVKTSLDGAPVTLLEIVPVREKDEDGDKWVKSYADTLKLWVGADSVPLALERKVKIKARIVVMSIEMERTEKRRFLRAGDRLVVTKYTTDETSSGFGQKEQSAQSTSVSIVR
jgi:hypothetical protein